MLEGGGGDIGDKALAGPASAYPWRWDTRVAALSSFRLATRCDNSELKWLLSFIAEMSGISTVLHIIQCPARLACGFDRRFESFDQ
jgi:hypothetical protein